MLLPAIVAGRDLRELAKSMWPSVFPPNGTADMGWDPCWLAYDLPEGRFSTSLYGTQNGFTQ